MPVRRGGAWSAVLAASRCAVHPRAAALLQAVAAALSLVSLPALPSRLVAGQAVLDAEADLALVAAELDETVAESIVALRHTDPAQVPRRRVRGARRGTPDRTRPAGRGARRRPAGSAGGARRARRDRARRRTTALDELPPAVAVLVERVAEAVCRQLGGRTRITASADDLSVKLRVESADNAIDASELERWRRRAHALRGELRHWPGGVELSLPTAPGDEGRHDDRLDL